MADTLTSPYNKMFPFLTLTVCVNTTVVALSCPARGSNSVLFHQTSMSGFILKKLLPYPDITIIVIVFLQYRYTGDSFLTIPRCNDVILPVPWYIVISEFYCNSIQNSRQTQYGYDSI